MNETDWAWIAGIVDGEGCLGCYAHGKNRTRSIVQIGNTDYKIISRLKKLCGGVSYEVTRKDRPKSKRIWMWCLYGNDLLGFLTKIEPYLISKKQKAIKIMRDL